MFFDTASLYFRAFFGLPETMRAPDGTPVNAVRGLLDFMARLSGQYRPDALVCAWDNDWRPAWRVDLVPGYKQHRLDPSPAPGLVVGAGGRGATTGWAEVTPPGLQVQVPIIREVLAALGIPVVGVDGYEADDVLASLCTQSAAESLVVTGDRDLFQLAHGRARVVYLGRGVANHDLVDDAWVRARTGVPASGYVDYATLRGDPSDGLPGVKGIGEKTAADLVTRFGGLEQIVAAAADPASALGGAVRARLAGALDYLARAREVVACVTDLPLPAEALEGRMAPPDPARLAQLEARYELGGSLVRIADQRLSW